MSTTSPKRRGGGIKLDNAVLAEATGKSERTPATPRPKAPASDKPAADADPAELYSLANPHRDAYEGEAWPNEPVIKLGTTLPGSLKGQVDGAVRFSQDVEEIAGINTFADFFRVACSRLVQDLQKEYNKGESFNVPRRLRRGRIPRD